MCNDTCTKCCTSRSGIKHCCESVTELNSTFVGIIVGGAIIVVFGMVVYSVICRSKSKCCPAEAEVPVQSSTANASQHSVFIVLPPPSYAEIVHRANGYNQLDDEKPPSYEEALKILARQVQTVNKNERIIESTKL